MITWRAAGLLGAGAALLSLVGVLVGDGISAPWLWVAAALIVLAVAAACVVDWLNAASPKLLRMSRTGDQSLWLGETGQVTLLLQNRSNRVLTGRVRDAWVPSAGATPTMQDVRIEPGRAVALVTRLTPTRRGDRPAVRVLVRSFGPFGLVYRQTSRATADRLTPKWRLRVYPR